MSPLGTNFLQIQSGTTFSRSSICSSTSPAEKSRIVKHSSKLQSQNTCYNQSYYILISTKSKLFIIIFWRSSSFVIGEHFTEQNIEYITSTRPSNGKDICFGVAEQPGLSSTCIKEPNHRKLRF